MGANLVALVEGEIVEDRNGEKWVKFDGRLYLVKQLKGSGTGVFPSQLQEYAPFTHLVPEVEVPAAEKNKEKLYVAYRREYSLKFEEWCGMAELAVGGPLIVWARREEDVVPRLRKAIVAPFRGMSADELRARFFTVEPELYNSLVFTPDDFV